MPALDRRITIHIEAEGHRNDHGEYVPGPVTDYPVWAQSTGAGDTFANTGAGSIITELRTYTVRWFRALDASFARFVTITDEYGDEWFTDGMNASDERRRFMLIRAGRVVE